MTMNRHDSTRMETEAVLARMRELIERSSLGEEAPRLLRRRTRPDQLLRVRQLLWQRESAPGDAAAEESVADRLVEAAGIGLPLRCPGRWMLTTGGALPKVHVSYADPAYRGQYNNDSATITRVAAGLRRACST